MGFPINIPSKFPKDQETLTSSPPQVSLLRWYLHVFSCMFGIYPSSDKHPNLLTAKGARLCWFRDTGRHCDAKVAIGYASSWLLLWSTTCTNTHVVTLGGGGRQYCFHLACLFHYVTSLALGRSDPAEGNLRSVISSKLRSSKGFPRSVSISHCISFFL